MQQATIKKNCWKVIPRRMVEIKVVSLPCSGKLDILYLTKAFDTGADGAAILICKEGECHYMEGNMRAKKRVQAIDELLEEAGLGKGRTKIIQMGDKGITGAIHELEDFLFQIKTMVEKCAVFANIADGIVFRQSMTVRSTGYET